MANGFVYGSQTAVVVGGAGPKATPTTFEAPKLAATFASLGMPVTNKTASPSTTYNYNTAVGLVVMQAGHNSIQISNTLMTDPGNLGKAIIVLPVNVGGVVSSPDPTGFVFAPTADEDGSTTITANAAVTGDVTLLVIVFPRN